MAKKEHDVKKNFEFDENAPDYNFQLKKKANLWWLLLLLLPLLLLIPLKKDITVVTKVDGKNEPFVDVRMRYTAHYLLWNMCFLADVPYDTVQQTDSTGTTVFKDVGYSVYSYIFHRKAPVVFSAGGDCYEEVAQEYRFHKVKRVTLDVQPKLSDVRLKVVDSELAFVLPSATVECDYDGKIGNRQVTDSTDAAGCIVVREVRYCGGFNRIKVSADGYADTVLTSLPLAEILDKGGEYVIPLRPLKARFTFFVKNKWTKEPIPNALAEVTLTVNGRVGSAGKSRTNVDGLGQGFFDNARVLAQVDITATKSGYEQGRYVFPKGVPNNVRNFKGLPDDQRVVWLEPKPETKQFRNVDTLSGQPIAGVTNKIVIKSIDGTEKTVEEISNRNGYFPVTAKPGDEITIVSTLDPSYHPKTTHIKKFKDAETIYMRPVMVTLTFRTVDGVSGSVLSGCNFAPRGSISGSLKYNETSPGVFEVTFRRDELVSITASKAGYGTNSTKVQNASYNQLGSQSDRDIPLRKDWHYERDGDDWTDCSGCNCTENECYDLYEAPVTFTFRWTDFCTGCTTFIVMDDNGNTLAEIGSGTNNNNKPGSVRLTSPTRKIWVKMTNQNCHPFHYYVEQ